ncbi:hypothetical protein [[Phormidium] sp. ETS-05]|uniref:hypothetical protein n=1 Tax=[Phormidium] sp. ETS-05 TaxID=222819 RepID=UPI0018EEF553|nr:hypothetical protein [[Phormidium] sp. ETS-05]
MSGFTPDFHIAHSDFINCPHIRGDRTKTRAENYVYLTISRKSDSFLPQPDRSGSIPH